MTPSVARHAGNCVIYGSIKMLLPAFSKMSLTFTLSTCRG